MSSPSRRERDLAAVIATLGEERFARAVARAIVRARAEAPIATTRRAGRHRGARGACAARHDPSGDADVPGAADLRQRRARRACGRPGGGGAHPGGLAGDWWWSSFHSLEDRIVKLFLAARCRPAVAGSRHQPEAAQSRPTTLPAADPQAASYADDAEVAANPRARSAKLRAAERTDAPAGQAGAAGIAAAAVARASVTGGAAMMMRLLNICVIVALVLAAARCLHHQVRVDPPGRAPGEAAPGDPPRARRHRRPAGGMGEARQSGAHPGAGEPASRAEADRCLGNSTRLDNLPARPPALVPLDEPDPIGLMIANPELVDRTPTASITPPKPASQTPAPKR